MLTDITLPGLQHPGRTCRGCPVWIPYGYTQNDLDDWTASLSEKPDKYVDPHGYFPEHAPGCRFAELPPVVLALCDETTALRYREQQRSAVPSATNAEPDVEPDVESL